MKSFVLDASVALRWLLDDPVVLPRASAKCSFEVIVLLCPPFWHLEIANGLAVAERRSLLSGEDIDRAFLEGSERAR